MQGPQAAAPKRALQRPLNRTVSRVSSQIIVLGWQESAVPQLLQQLQDVVPMGSHITVLLPHPQTHLAAAGDSSSDSSILRNHKQQHSGSSVQQQQQQKQETVQQGSSTLPGQCAVLRVPEPGSMQSFLAAGINTADAVVLGATLSAAAPPANTEADALVTAAMLAIQQGLQAVRPPQDSAALEQPADPDAPRQGGLRRLHVVADVASCSVRRALQCFLSSVLLQCGFSYEIMVLDEFAAGMLVSVAQDLSNALVLQSLQEDQAGRVLCMLTLQDLGLAAGPCVWSDVMEAARPHRCTALGYRRADGRMVLVPSLERLALAADGRIVGVGGANKRWQLPRLP